MVRNVSARAERGGFGCGTTALALAVTACAVAVLLGSIAHGTTRVREGDRPGYRTGMQEGALRWAVWTFSCGAAALAAVGIAAWATLSRHPGLGAIPAALAAPPFVLASVVAGRHWFRRIAERDGPRDYALTIAAGLPIVTLVGAAGALLALLLAAALVARR